MSYGNGTERKDWLMKAFPLGVNVGTPTDGKIARLTELHGLVLDLMRKMATETFSQEPLLPSNLLGGTMDEQLCAIQNAAEGLNACWREQARMRVKPAIAEGNRRYFAKLIGRLCFVDKVSDADPAWDAKQKAKNPEYVRQKYWYVPVEVQDDVTEEELCQLNMLMRKQPPTLVSCRTVIRLPKASCGVSLRGDFSQSVLFSLNAQRQHVAAICGVV